MNKKIAAMLVGGAFVASVAFGVNSISSAAEKPQNTMPMQGMMTQGNNQMGNMDPKAMADMMKSPEMQKQCTEAMKSPEMQQAMKDIMKQPEMQTMMKQMLQQDPAFHQMMLDLVNSVDMNSDHSAPPVTSGTDTGAMTPSEHASHHMM